MKSNLIIAINLGDYGSTGVIMRNAVEYAHKYGDFDYLILTPSVSNKDRAECIKTNLTPFQLILRKFSLLTRRRGRDDGFFYKETSKKIISIIHKNRLKYKNIIIHCHNLHHSFIDVEYLFKKFAIEKIPVVYTIHDEWLFTGGCYCYSHINCDRWKIGCKKCPLHIYNATKKLAIKKRLIDNLPQIKLVAVSNWLKNEIQQSVFSSKDIEVIYGETNIEKRDNKYLADTIVGAGNVMLLSVAAYWSEWKGAKYLYNLSSYLPDNFKIVIVGRGFPESYKNEKIIVIDRELNDSELADLYSTADIYLSTSQSETLGLTTCEAQICGCPVVGFGNCGSRETISPESGIIVDNEDVKMMANKIFEILKKGVKKEKIIEFGNRFSKNSNSPKYLKIYEDLIWKH